ncbi:MAG TPA: AraC family transcriptional regulator [Microvirga sp.]|jgi:AraC-like DNA-binding protein|nr:AraC family transcriptional regulator [Microvirga sp.]
MPAERSPAAVPKVPTARFSTGALPPEDRFEAWRGTMAASHEVTADPVDFTGEVVSTRLDGMIVHVMRASPQTTARDERRIRRDGLEHLVLYLNAAPARADTGDAEIDLPPHAISVSDLSRTNRRSTSPELDSIVVSISRDLVAEARGHTDGLHGTILEHGAGALLVAHLRNLAWHAPTVEQASAAAVARGTAQLLAACLDPSRNNLELARPQVETAALARARRYIDANVGAFELSPERLTQAVGVSRSTLFRLFEPFGGVARYITGRRLHAARRALGNPHTRLRISEIAHRHGFASDARFSREFKRSFGLSPSEFVRDGAAVAGRDPISALGGFAEWVRDIG